MKTKNYEIYFSVYTHLYRWTVLFDLDMESTGKEYVEINLSILCFTFSFQLLSKAFSAKLDKLKKDIK